MTTNTPQKPPQKKAPKKAPPRHHNIFPFEVKEKQLLINGYSIEQIAGQIGQTPFYAYDRNLIKARIDDFRAAMPKALKLHYAIKANPMPALVDFIADHVDGLDVASHQELLVALNSGKTPAQISFAGPGKSDIELKAAIASQIIINIESFKELERIEGFAKQLALKAKIAIRINPDFELKSSGMKMAGGAKPFGIDAEKVLEFLPQFKSEHIELMGFHIFCGSQNLNPDAIIETHQQTFALGHKLIAASPYPIKHLNIGGGLGIPYFPGDKPLDLSLVAKPLESLCESTQKAYPELEIIMELGRYLVAEAGIYVCQVSDIKESRGETYVVVNGGLHHHLANSGNFGQVIRKNYPVLIANKCVVNQSENEIEEQVAVNIVGPLCTPLDILGQKVTLPACEIGDYIAILQSGAYGKTASPENFLSHPDVIERLI